MESLNNNFVVENMFYHTCTNDRFAKMVAFYEFYKMTAELAGNVAEFGVFKGTSLIRLATFREFYGGSGSKTIYAFDTFTGFPKTNDEVDRKDIDIFLEKMGQGLNVEEILEIMEFKGIKKNIEFIKGDICETLPKFIENNPQCRFSLVNLDVDFYEAANTVLENIWDRIVSGGILILDDYSVFHGETKAVDEFFKDKNIKIQKLQFTNTPFFVVK